MQGPEPHAAVQPGIGTRARVPRPYQLAAEAAVEAGWARGLRAQLVVAATGTGKTVLFARAARRAIEHGWSPRVLVLAHREELLDQARAKLLDEGCEAAVEQADRRARSAAVVVASVQTLRGARLAALDPREFGLVIVDEAHHANAASYRRVLEHFAGVRVLGVTATPARGDGQALGDVFEHVAFRYDLRDAIRDRWLVPLVARRVVVKAINLAGVRVARGDLAVDELSAAMCGDEQVLGVVLPVLEQSGARPTVVFAVTVAHAVAIAAALNERRPGCALVAHGELERDQRADVLARFRSGSVQYLVNCALYTEGFDEASVACVVLARPTKSWALYVQMVGRGTRLLGATLDESIARGKRDCLLLDVVGITGKHKLVGPLDALAAGEPISDDVREECERRLAAGAEDLDGLADDAARELAAQRRVIRDQATADYLARELDPFIGDIEVTERFPEEWERQVASIGEVERVRRLGFDKFPHTASRADAARIERACAARSRAGLCTVKQAKALARARYNASSWSFQRASEYISDLARANWNPTIARSALQRLDAKWLLLDRAAGVEQVDEAERDGDILGGPARGVRSDKKGKTR